MSQTLVVGARVPRDDAELFRKQAARHGLSTSAALTALIRTSIALERQAPAGDSDELADGPPLAA